MPRSMGEGDQSYIRKQYIPGSKLLVGKNKTIYHRLIRSDGKLVLTYLACRGTQAELYFFLSQVVSKT